MITTLEQSLNGGYAGLRRTAILFSGMAYNFNFSIQSLMDNLVVPSDADVFILTSRFNMRRKVEASDLLVLTEANEEEFFAKANRMVRDESQPVTHDDVNLINDVFGGRLKGIWFIEDMPEYLEHLAIEQERMMKVVNDYRKESIDLGLPPPFGSDVGDPTNGNVRVVVHQYQHVQQCYELMEQYESKRGIRYDFVMRARICFKVSRAFDIRDNISPNVLSVCGSLERDPFEWMDDFCWFSDRTVASLLFPNLKRMGFITDRKYNTVHLPQDNDFVFAPETQFSLLLHELNIPIKNVNLYRTPTFTNGGDGWDYLNYMFTEKDPSWHSRKPLEATHVCERAGVHFLGEEKRMNYRPMTATHCVFQGIDGLESPQINKVGALYEDGDTLIFDEFIFHLPSDAGIDSIPECAVTYAQAKGFRVEAL